MKKEQKNKILKELADSKVKIKHLSTKLDRIEDIIQNEDCSSKEETKNVPKGTEKPK